MPGSVLGEPCVPVRACRGCALVCASVCMGTVDRDRTRGLAGVRSIDFSVLFYALSGLCLRAPFFREGGCLAGTKPGSPPNPQGCKHHRAPSEVGRGSCHFCSGVGAWLSVRPGTDPPGHRAWALSS